MCDFDEENVKSLPSPGIQLIFEITGSDLQNGQITGLFPNQRNDPGCCRDSAWVYIPC